MKYFILFSLMIFSFNLFAGGGYEGQPDDPREKDVGSRPTPSKMLSVEGQNKLVIG